MKRNGFILGLLLLAASAQAGNELGNGGDSYAQEFVSLGRGIVERMRAHPDPKVGDVDALAAAVEGSKVVTMESVALEGAEVDAVNYPESKRIELSRSRWKMYDAQEKAALVLHEYLGIARIEDSNYQVSGSYNRAVAELDKLSLPSNEVKRFAIGIGSGIDSFTGNIGKLYSSSNPVINPRISFLLNPYFTLNAGPEFSTYNFNAAPLGSVVASIKRLGIGTEFHFFQSRQWTGGMGFDPYFLLGVEHVWRTQTFQALNTVDKDNAVGIGAGFGTKYVLIPRRTAFWLEARASQIYFKDRYSDQYTPSGIHDTTGLLLAGSVGLQYYF